MCLHDDTLATVDQAFFQLRRMWAKPQLARQLSGQEGGRRLQLSNLMVISAVSHLQAESAGEVTVGAVADRLDVDPSTASRLVGHAIEAGLVARLPSPVDARRASLELTPAGQRVRETATRYRRHYIARLMADWTDHEQADFARLLRKFTDAAVATPFGFGGAEKIFEAAHSAREGEPVPEDPEDAVRGAEPAPRTD